MIIIEEIKKTSNNEKKIFYNIIFNSSLVLTVGCSFVFAQNRYISNKKQDSYKDNSIIKDIEDNMHSTKIMNICFCIAIILIMWMIFYSFLFEYSYKYTSDEKK